MFLSNIQIKNFRSCHETNVDLTDHTTVLVGENGSGKSNIVDAIRLTLNPVSGKRMYYWDESRDLSRLAAPGTPISVSLTFKDLTPHEAGIYMPYIDGLHLEMAVHTQFDTTEGLKYGLRLRQSTGQGGAIFEQDVKQRIGCVYLPALRDAVRELDIGPESRLSGLLNSLATEEQKADFISHGNEAIDELSNSALVKAVQETLSIHLNSITLSAVEHEVSLHSREQSLRQLSRLLKLHLAEAGMPPMAINGQSLGFANLLFIATVILELESSHDRDLTLVLVEEPEAHLHPQLQTVLLSYLESRAKKSSETIPPNGRPMGRIQVLVTSHSPNIASAVSISSIVHTQSEVMDNGLGHESLITPEAIVQRNTITALLGSRIRKTKDRRKIDRYLSVTRSSLLFARNLIMVEGLSEALCIQALAEQCLFLDDPDLQRRFNAVTVLSVDGVDFEPYLQLVLGEYPHLAKRVSVVTDGDSGAGNNRKRLLEQKFSSATEDQRLSVFVSDYTFEADLIGCQMDPMVFKECYLEMHPHSGGKWDGIIQGDNPDNESVALRFYQAMQTEGRNSIRFSKGEFAQVISERLGRANVEERFVIPDYLRLAILHAMGEGSNKSIVHEVEHLS